MVALDIFDQLFISQWYQSKPVGFYHDIEVLRCGSVEVLKCGSD